MNRTKVYIDGFNLYHAIDELNNTPSKPFNYLKWLNLKALSEQIIKDDDLLVGVEYFSAFKKTNLDRFKRHEQYVKALEYFGVNVHLGVFKKKYHTCKVCKKEYQGWEEKETDVNLAIRLVDDAHTDQFDKALIITADTDLLPPAKLVKERFPDKQVIFVSPPKRMGRSRSLSPLFEITKGRLKKSLLPESEHTAEGEVIFQRPTEYDPPS